MAMAVIQNNDDIWLQGSQAPETTVKCILFPGRGEICEVQLVTDSTWGLQTCVSATNPYKVLAK